MKRTCKKCGVEKDIELFVKDKTCKYGRSYTCRRCASDYMKNRYAIKPYYQKKGKKKLLNKQQRQANRKQTCKKYRQNPDAKEKENIYGRKKQKEWCCALDDNYIKKTFLNSLGIKADSVTPEMIELKREIIQYKRITKELNNVINRR